MNFLFLCLYLLSPWQCLNRVAAPISAIYAVFSYPKCIIPPHQIKQIPSNKGLRLWNIKGKGKLELVGIYVWELYGGKCTGVISWRTLEVMLNIQDVMIQKWGITLLCQSVRGEVQIYFILYYISPFVIFLKFYVLFYLMGNGPVPPLAPYYSCVYSRLHLPAHIPELCCLSETGAMQWLCLFCFVFWWKLCVTANAARMYLNRHL